MTSPLETLSVTQAERDRAHAAGNSLPDKSYPINNVHQLHAAAVLAASHHGDWKAAQALIRRRAKELGVDVNTLPGFGGDSHAAPRDPAREQRRKRWANSLIGNSERRGMQMEMRTKPNGSGGTDFVFEGYASVFDTPFPMFDKYGDPYTEIVRPGAFTQSLSRGDVDVRFFVGHDQGRLTLARTRNGTMQLSQDSKGLLTHAVMDGRRSDVRDLAYAVERGDQDGMSIGFVTRKQEWSADYETRNMLDLDLHDGDVSSVSIPAIPQAAGASMVPFPAESLSRQAVEARAAATTDDPDSDHMTPMVGPNHGDFTGTHIHDHDDHGSPNHMPHEHAHDNDHAHNHHALSITANMPADDRSAGRPLERLAQPMNIVDQNMGDGPEYNPDQQVKCTRATCAAGPNGALGNHPAQKYCGWCGDALVRIDDQGVPGMEEEDGAQAALAQRRRALEFLALAR